MRLHTGGCINTVRDPALELDSVRKEPWRTGEFNPCQHVPNPTLSQLSYIPAPALEQVGDTWSQV